MATTLLALHRLLPIYALDTVPYADATLSAAVRCIDDKILNLQSTLNASTQISLL